MIRVCELRQATLCYQPWPKVRKEACAGYGAVTEHLALSLFVNQQTCTAARLMDSGWTELKRTSTDDTRFCTEIERKLDGNWAEIGRNRNVEMVHSMTMSGSFRFAILQVLSDFHGGLIAKDGMVDYAAVAAFDEAVGALTAPDAAASRRQPKVATFKRANEEFCLLVERLESRTVCVCPPLPQQV
eukprot:6492597-Amphidinium_carterae.4